MPNVNTLLDDHVTLKYEFVDRIFLNGYVARLQEPDQLAWFLCQHRGEEIPRYELLGKMTREFVAAIEQLAQDRHIRRDINRRLLEMERQSCRPAPTVSLFEALVMPTGEPGHRAPGLRFGDPRVVALFGALSQFRPVFGGFYARDLRPLVEQHLASPYTMRQMAYDLRRLIRKDLLERLPGSNRYQLTVLGRRLILFAARLYSHVFCRGLARLEPDYPAGDLNLAWRNFEVQLGALLSEARMAA